MNSRKPIVYALRRTFFLLIILCLLPVARAQISDYPNSRITTNAPDLGKDTPIIHQLEEQGHKWRPINQDSALYFYQRAYRMAAANNIIKDKVTILSYIVGCYMLKGDYDRCVTLIDSATRMAKDLDNGNALLTLNVTAAAVYQGKSDLLTSFAHHFKAIEIIKKYKMANTYNAALEYLNFGALWQILNQQQYADKYTLKGKEILQNMKPVDSLVLFYAVLNMNTNHFDSSVDRTIKNLLPLKKTIERQGDHKLTHGLYQTLSAAYEKKGDYATALNYSRQSAQYAVSDQDKATTAFRTGHIYLETESYDKAMRYLSEAEALAKQSHAIITLQGVYADYATLFAARGQYKTAYSYHLKADSLVAEQQALDDEKVLDMILRFETFQKDNELTEQQLLLQLSQQKIQKKNNLIVSSFILIGLLLLSAGILYRNYRIKQRLQSERLRTYDHQKQIEMLKAATEGEERERRRIAHDLHDGIMIRFAGVKMKLDKLISSHPDKTLTAPVADLSYQLDAATKELRLTAHNLMPEVLLAEGIEQALFYFCKTIEEISELKVKFLKVGERLPRFSPDFECLLYRIVQELVQNIVKHAKATTALVQLNYHSGFLSVTVEDNGAGIPEKKTTGIGLKSIESRIKIYEGTLSIDSVPDKGTTVYMEFELSRHLKS